MKTITGSALLTTLFTGLLIAPLSHSATVEEIRTFTPQPGLQYKFEIDDFIAPTEEEADAIRFTSRNHFYKQAITSTKPRITSTEEFLSLPGTLTKITIPAGKNALVNLAFTAESRCNEPGSSAPDWCEVRILVDGVEASPQASSLPPTPTPSTAQMVAPNPFHLGNPMQWIAIIAFITAPAKWPAPFPWKCNGR